ncbi:hypothetical protein ACFOUV_13615 [Oceanobacillus longus]|uniref:Phospholipid phosphatase n=1 Tax=Oceanobacillus longus TaxID=930120 RepID=A0ABV8H1U5_9BACI
MDLFLFAIFTFLYIALLIWGIKLAAKYGWSSSANIVLFVVVGLIYDNGILALGRFIGEGNILEALNLARYWLHAFFTPLLVIFSWNTVKRANMKSVKSKGAMYVTILITIGLVIIELITEVVGISLKATSDYGLLSYENVEPSNGPPMMVLIISVILLIASIIVWWRQKWIWFFIGSAIMIGGSFIPIPIESGAATNLFELILMTSLIATKSFQDKKSSR